VDTDRCANRSKTPSLHETLQRRSEHLKGVRAQFGFRSWGMMMLMTGVLRLHVIGARKQRF